MKIALVCTTKETALFHGRIMPLAKELNKKHNCVVFSNSCNYYNLEKKTEIIDGVKVIYTGQFHYKDPEFHASSPKRTYLSPARTFFEGLRFAVRTLREIKKFRPDIIQLFTSHPYMYLLALELKTTSFKVVGDIDDLLGEGGFIEHTSAYYSGDRKLVGVLNFVEKRIYKHYKGLTVGSHYLADKYRNKNPIVISNPVDTMFYNNVKRKLKLAAKVNIVFHSRIKESSRSDIDTLVEMMEFLKKNFSNKEVSLYIIGDGSYMKKLKENIEKRRLSKYIHLPGWMEKEKLVSYLKSADIAVFPIVKNPLNEARCPLKVLEFMAAGLPIVTSNFGELPFLLDKNNAIIMDGFSAEDYAEGVKFLTKKKKLRQKLGKNSLKRIRSFDQKNIAKEYLEFYEKFIRQIS